MWNPGMVDRVTRVAAIVLGLVLAGSALAGDPEAPTAKSLLDAHLKARGGAERWKEVETLEIEGTWTAFSLDVPMTIRRMRPNLYRFDHVVFDMPITLAFDGERAWVRSVAFGAPDGTEINDDSKRNVILDAPFGSKLLAHAAAGAEIEHLGTEDVEGEDCHVLRVTLEGMPEETWYLDTDTFLETKRVSKTFDVFSGPGIELEMETFFMNFAEVGGVVIPFREERHFGTRYRVFEATSIKVNPGFEAGIFGLPEKQAPDPQENPGGGT
jgi:hypothetical protein